MKELLNPNKYGKRLTCMVCDRQKRPVGRSVAAVLEPDMCGDHCEGYRQLPIPGSLWPNESEKDFGYPVASVGTEIREAGRPLKPFLNSRGEWQ